MTRRPCRKMTTVLPLGQLRSSGIQAILIDQPMRWWMRWAVSASNQRWARPRSVDHRSPFFYASRISDTTPSTPTFHRDLGCAWHMPSMFPHRSAYFQCYDLAVRLILRGSPRRGPAGLRDICPLGGISLHPQFSQHISYLLLSHRSTMIESGPRPSSQDSKPSPFIFEPLRR